MITLALAVILAFAWEHPNIENVDRWTIYYTETSGDYSDDMKGEAVAYCADSDLDGMWECTSDVDLPYAPVYYFKLTGSNEWGESDPTPEISTGTRPVAATEFTVEPEGDQ